MPRSTDQDHRLLIHLIRSFFLSQLIETKSGQIKTISFWESKRRKRFHSARFLPMTCPPITVNIAN